MKYHEIEPMCRPRSGVRGCPHDGLGCTGGERCSINRPDKHAAAFNASQFGPDFYCVKRANALREALSDG